MASYPYEEFYLHEGSTMPQQVGMQYCEPVKKEHYIVYTSIDCYQT